MSHPTFLVAGAWMVGAVMGVNTTIQISPLGEAREGTTIYPLPDP